MEKTYQIVTEKKTQVASLAEYVLMLHTFVLKFALNKTEESATRIKFKFKLIAHYSS